MNPLEQLQKDIREIKEWMRDIDRLDLKQHRHTGLGSQKVKFTDLDTVMTGEFTIDPASLADGAGETHSVTLAGANLGDFVLVSASYDLQDLTVTGYVQAADTIEIRIQNESGGVIDLASGTWRVIVIKRPI